MGDIKIDSKAFQERLSHFITAWKGDKRSGDALFAGASSIVVLMGKVEEEPEFYKNNAMHVRLMMMDSPSQLSRRADLSGEPTVLAARLRVPDHPHALHPRHPLHPHHPEERFAPSPTRSHNVIAKPDPRLLAAKYLDQIKGSRFPVEVLVRGKDAAENEKLFVKITDAIKAAGVSHESHRFAPLPPPR